MRINTNVSALNTQRQLGITNQNVSNSITRLSSGFRINRAADDAAGLGIANKLRGDIRSMTQAVRNGEQANSMIQIAEGAVSGIATMLDRMKELATQANSDTVDEFGRDRLDAEFQALIEEIDRTASTTKFGETELINGGDDFSFMVSSSGSYDDADLLTFEAVDVTSTTLAVGSLNLQDVASAQAALEAVDTAIGTVNENLGQIGAFQNRIENAIANTKTAIENLSASESVIRDLDMAEEMTRFSKNQILQQAGTAMLAQANSASQNVLQLLRG